jgi:hypothetical protein
MRQWILLLSLAILTGGCTSDNSKSEAGGEQNVGPASLLYVWAGDLDKRPSDTDFLAVVDSDPDSPSYGEILATEAVGVVGTNPHHTEPVVPTGGVLLANGYNAGRTFLFDLSAPDKPNLVGELAPVPEYEFPHSFLRLDEGELIATMQYGDGSIPGNPGGLARFDSEANLISITSAADPAFEGEQIRSCSVRQFWCWISQIQPKSRKSVASIRRVISRTGPQQILPGLESWLRPPAPRRPIPY